MCKTLRDKLLYTDTQYSEDGQMLYLEHYYKSNNIWFNHNYDGPAIEYWYLNGQKKSEHYYIDGKMHNENGPAHQEWHSNGKLKNEEYWINGIEYTKSEWIIKIRNLKLKKLNDSNLRIL